MPIITEGQLNLASLQTDDIYVIVVPPATPLIPGFPTDGVGVVGVAQRGKPNVPLLVTDPSSLVRTFGNIGGTGVVGVPHPNDMVTDILGAMKQRDARGWEAWHHWRERSCCSSDWCSPSYSNDHCWDEQCWRFNHYDHFRD